jgi:hypothetical protein
LVQSDYKTIYISHTKHCLWVNNCKYGTNANLWGYARQISHSLLTIW